MDRRASLPVSLPVPNPTTSYWHTLSPPPGTLPPDFRSTTGLPRHCSTVIIGSGISGASIAYNLLLNHAASSPTDPEPRVLLLEARTLCSGATGRNGGHTKAASYRSFLGHVSSLGEGEAVKIARLEYDNIKAVHNFAKQHGIECDLVEGDTVDVVYDEGQWVEAQEAVGKMRGVFSVDDPVGRYELLTKEELERDYFVHDYDYGGKREEIKGGVRPKGSEFEGDVIMGGGLVRGEEEEGLKEFGVSDDSGFNEGISEYLRETTPRYFGRDWGDDHQEGRIRREWTGIMGFSPDGFPFVGEVPGQEGLWVSSSFQGHGMVLCWMCADAVVKMMRGQDHEEELKGWFPDIFRITEERLKKRFRGRLS
ncbi:FAD dependent oxidoreductase-domain-containing protein [Apiosordaria backusii]|uniref:FAD dependent oxidoreductase-domain-containing protein n=1 Tax=Apiosordaria backusii TaxID=314023 RepID=A0AA39ZUX5_9PEZI|nr:FAD dependent oxidoreductase-domain-containing protein [Apiosordaria backusii]